MATVKAAQEIYLSNAAVADFNIEVVRAQLPKCNRFFLRSQQQAARNICCMST
jgi:hypothetical protein